MILDGRPGSSATAGRSPALGPGGFFGDLALLDRAPRNATVIADTDLELAMLGQRAFDGLLELPGFRRSCSPASPGGCARAGPARTARGSFRRREDQWFSPCATQVPKPHQLVLVVGVAGRALHARLGLRAPAHRVERRLEHRPRALRRRPRRDLLGVLRRPRPSMLFVCAWLVSLRVRNYERGAPDDRRTTKKNLHRRMRDFRAGVWMQTLLRDPAAGLMHSSSTSGSCGCSSPPSCSRSTTSSPTTSSSSTAASTRGTRSPPTSAASSSPSASCGRWRGATSSGRTASASRPSPRTRSSSSRSS